jgi:hypothetical protein
MARRKNDEIAAVRKAAREELATHHPMTLRQVHYRLVSRPDIVHPNTKSAYDKLSEWLRDDRLNGDVKWEWMEDRLRVEQDWPMWDDPKEFLLELREDYARNVWQDQTHYVEVWCEKDALSGLFKAALTPFRVTLNIGRGYDSWSAIKRAADRYRIRKDKQGMDTTVLYFGDFDPSGEDMHRSLIERFGMLGAYPDVPKVALTYAEAQRMPFSLTKGGDSRRDAFVAQYGDLAVELDALPVEELRLRIRASVRARMDIDALVSSYETEEVGQQFIRDSIDHIFEDDGQAS